VTEQELTQVIESWLDEQDTRLRYAFEDSEREDLARHIIRSARAQTPSTTDHPVIGLFVLAAMAFALALVLSLTVACATDISHGAYRDAIVPGVELAVFIGAVKFGLWTWQIKYRIELGVSREGKRIL
jgi:hypothetical protein